MTAVFETNFQSYAKGSPASDSGPFNWVMGLFLAFGIHAVGFSLALSSGAGFSLQPEGGGGTGGMSVTMGSGSTGHDVKTQTAKRVEAMASQVSTPEVLPQKPVVKPAAKPKQTKKPANKVMHKVVQATSAKTTAQIGERKTISASAAPGSQIAEGIDQGHGDVSTVAGGGPVGPSVGAGTSKGFGIDTAKKAYTREIRKLLLRAKQYPKTAQRLGQEGVVKVSFIISPDGQSSGIQIIKSSRYPSLNREAKALIRRVGTFPPIPSKISNGPMTFEVPIPFRLY